MGVMQTEGLEGEIWILRIHIKKKKSESFLQKQAHISYFDFFLQY